MKVIASSFSAIRIFELQVFKDSRGFFTERFNEGVLDEIGVKGKIAQFNHSRSEPRVLRGLHYQHTPPQGKLVSVIRGAAWDVVVDIRPGSQTFGESLGVELTEDNGRAIWVPAGFAHGFCVLSQEPCDLVYAVTAPYNREGEGGIRWDDPDLAIDWPVKDPLLSPRDLSLPSFREYLEGLVSNPG